MLVMEVSLKKWNSTRVLRHPKDTNFDTHLDEVHTGGHYPPWRFSMWACSVRSLKNHSSKFSWRFCVPLEYLKRQIWVRGCSVSSTRLDLLFLFAAYPLLLYNSGCWKHSLLVTSLWQPALSGISKWLSPRWENYYLDGTEMFNYS